MAPTVFDDVANNADLDANDLIAAPGQRQRITDELRRARAATGGWIDTDFYKDFMQVSAPKEQTHVRYT